MDSKRECDAVAAFSGRIAGSDAERRAAVHLRDRLRRMGRDADLEAIEVWPRVGLAHTFHALLAIVGSVVAVSDAVAGSALVLAAGVLTLLDLTGVAPSTRRLAGRRASQNVFSPEDCGRAGTLILAAHYDVPATPPPSASRAARCAHRGWCSWPPCSAAGVLCPGVLGIEGTALTAAQFLPTVLLIVLIPALADLELSDAGTGEADNAAGVSTVLALAEELGASLRSFDVWVVLTGSNAPLGTGMRAWLKRHRGELHRERTAVINIDGVGSGPVRFARREGPLLARRAHPQLLKICKEIAEDDGPAARMTRVRRASASAPTPPPPAGESSPPSRCHAKAARSPSRGSSGCAPSAVT